jgi:hypothetical protein
MPLGLSQYRLDVLVRMPRAAHAATLTNDNYSGVSVVVFLGLSGPGRAAAPPAAELLSSVGLLADEP